MNIDEIKRKKLEEIQQKYQQGFNEEEALKNQVEQIEALAKQLLDKEALSRFGNIKIAHPEKAIQLASVLIQMARTGRLKEKLNDEQLKQILTMLQEKKDFTIKRK
ncbi:hypothetical protein J4413_00845 [Candidatus Woesearchaeota archaeon]|nr:hypothetical protein [Candidatus Woesearchaeota archaeon]